MDRNAMAPIGPLRTHSGIAYWTIGKGPTVLTIHGGPGTDHSFFRPYLDPLAEDRQVVYFDLPGHGQSAPPTDYGLDTMAMAIGEVRDTLEVDHVSLIGSSYGGFLSLLYTLQKPGAVASLILVDTSASYGFRQESLETARQRGTPSMLAALDRLWNGSLQTDEEFHAAWRKILPLYFHQLQQREIRRIADGSSYRLETRKQILPTFQNYDVRHQLTTIDVPSLVMVGRHDWITSVAQAEELAARLAHSELLIFEESGHYPFIEETGSFLQKIQNWLTAHDI
jgi:proline iminopeptidase